ncbi:MAG: hypothetical protein JSS34_02800 [Proteobacteria bacterium]|nr:hypothetical protein [Pseudomonadota bacterium]
MGTNQILKYVSLLTFLKFFILSFFLVSHIEAGITASSLTAEFKDEVKEKSFGSVFVQIIKASQKAITNFNVAIFDDDYIFSSFSISDIQIHILHTTTGCLIDTGKSYIYCAIGAKSAPDFLEKSPKFEGSKIECISQLMTPEVGINLLEILGENGFSAIKHFLKLKSGSRIRSARIKYGNGDSPWMHFLLKPEEEKSWRLYCAASLKKNGDGKSNLISKGFTEYIEDIDNFIKVLELAKSTHSFAASEE